MKNNRISKITILTALFIGGIVNAQEFYTCVPKRNWWLDIVREGNLKNKWELIINLTPNLNIELYKQKLYPGKYRIYIAAGGGDEIVKEFTLDKVEEFKACVGAGGEAGSYGVGNFGRGGNGGGGMGYKGHYSGGARGWTNNEWDGAGKGGNGYGKGKAGEMVPWGGNAGIGGYGCYGGGGGGWGWFADGRSEGTGGGGGGGAGSYFQINNLEIILRGANGGIGYWGSGGYGSRDGFIKIEKWE